MGEKLMEIRKLILAILSVFPSLFDAEGLAEKFLPNNFEAGKALSPSILTVADNKLTHVTYEYVPELTPLGAEKAGNKDGTIPPWTGGITSPPTGYKKGAFHPDPFADDKIMFTIDARNVDKYRDKLAPGQIALLRKYPSFKLHVYPTHRSASFPQRIYDATLANRKTARLIKDGNIVTGAIMGIPFPEPRNGQEAVWNHLLRYRGDAVSLINNQAAVTAGGAYTLLKSKEEWYFVYNSKDATPKNIKNKMLYFIQEFMEPPSIAGSIYLLHDPLDYTLERRSVWGYFPGQRRVSRISGFEYDLLPGATEGLRTIDQYDMYTGAIDLYDWKLLGKRELYVPYNAYKLHSNSLKYTDILKSGHINTGHARYEIHRVWVVDASLKKGKKHLYPHRTFYLDEDSWQILIIDIYDTKGDLWRVSEGHVINYYEVPTIWTTLQVHYDLKSGRYYVSDMDNEERMYDFSIRRSPKDYNPAVLRKLGKR
jgi:hypothetical protein